MAGEMVDLIVSWPSFAGVLIVFGFAPRAVLRIIVLAFERDDPRRDELLAEVNAVPRLERPFWVAEQLEVAVFEGLRDRVVWLATGRVIHRWRLGSGVESNRLYPDTFEIPTDDDKAAIKTGDSVRAMFQMRDGWCERMWVKVERVRRGTLIGRLSNQPVGIPRLTFGERVKLKPDHVIDIVWHDLDDEPEHLVSSLPPEDHHPC